MDFFGADVRPDLAATPVFAARFGRGLRHFFARYGFSAFNCWGFAF